MPVAAALDLTRVLVDTQIFTNTIQKVVDAFDHAKVNCKDLFCSTDTLLSSEVIRRVSLRLVRVSGVEMSFD